MFNPALAGMEGAMEIHIPISGFTFRIVLCCAAALTVLFAFAK